MFHFYLHVFKHVTKVTGCKTHYVIPWATPLACKTNANLTPVSVKSRADINILHLNTHEDGEREGSSDNNEGHKNQNPAKTSQPRRVLICRDS